MAKVRLTRKTFSDILSKNTDKAGFEMMFMKALTGKDASELLKGVPDEQVIFVDTDRVVAVGPLTKVQETGDLVFQLYFDCNDKDLQNFWIKGNEMEDFLHVWAGKHEWLDEGVYKVGMGIKSEPGQMVVEPEMWAEVSEDRLTVTVHRIKPI